MCVLARMSVCELNADPAIGINLCVVVSSINAVCDALTEQSCVCVHV